MNDAAASQIRHRPFALFWATRIASILGVQIAMVALAWMWLFPKLGRIRTLGSEPRPKARG